MKKSNNRTTNRATKKMQRTIKEMNTIQVAIHTKLGNFLHGANVTKATLVCYPIIDKCNNDFSTVKEKIITNESLKNEFQESLQKIEAYAKTSQLSTKQYASILISLYKEFYDVVKKRDKQVKKQTNSVYIQDDTLWQKQAKTQTSSTIKETQRIKRSIEVFNKQHKLIKNCILHGSFATLDFTNWSDLDMLLLLEKQALENKETLLTLREFIMKQYFSITANDPLAHHGFFIITHEQMQWYQEAHIPIVVIKNGVSLLEENKHTFLTVPSKEQMKEAYTREVQFLNKAVKQIKQNTPISAFTWKSIFSSIQFLPCLAVQIQEKPIDKPQAIKKISKKVGSKKARALEIATRIRETWNYKQEASSKTMFRSKCFPFLRRAMHKRKVTKPNLTKTQRQELAIETKRYIDAIGTYVNK